MTKSPRLGASRFSLFRRGIQSGMTTKAAFTAEEWALLRQGPPLAAMRVIVAESGGRPREIESLGRAYGNARHGDPELKGPTGLIDEIVTDAPHIDQSRFGTPDAPDVAEVCKGAAGCLREAVGVLERSATVEELEDYRRFVLRLAQRVAAVPAEGGPFGTSGTSASDSEVAALDEIADALGWNS
jgi:hypothetical protein